MQNESININTKITEVIENETVMGIHFLLNCCSCLMVPSAVKRPNDVDNVSPFQGDRQ